MPWQVIEIEDDVHVVPCCFGGHVIAPHMPTYLCECKPEAEDQGTHILYLHNDMIGNADATNIH